MNVDEVGRATLKWLRYAREDLNAADLLLKDSGIVPRIVCWNAQQSAEKSIKSILIFNQVDFPYSHDIKLLLTLVPDRWAIKHSQLDIAGLTDWATSAQYPGNAPEASSEDATDAFKTASSILEIVLDDFRRHGFDPAA